MRSYHADLGQVPERECRVRVALGQDDEHGSLQFHPGQKLFGPLCGGLLEGQGVEHVELAVLRLRRERPVEGGRGLFAVDPLSVTRWLGLRTSPGTAALANG